MDIVNKHEVHGKSYRKLAAEYGVSGTVSPLSLHLDTRQLPFKVASLKKNGIPLFQFSNKRFAFPQI